MEKEVSVCFNLKDWCRFLVSTSIDYLDGKGQAIKVIVKPHPDDMNVFNTISNQDGVLQWIAMSELKSNVPPEVSSSVAKYLEDGDTD